MTKEKKMYRNMKKSYICLFFVSTLLYKDTIRVYKVNLPFYFSRENVEKYKRSDVF